jgi:release factor glutamine methyltransferase
MKRDPSIQVEVGEIVYPPAEDTFLLLSAIEVCEGQLVLEMGCGTGIIALHCAKAGCLVTAADSSPAAVESARGNAVANRLRVDVINSDLFENVQGRFDVIIFNPPYLSSQDTAGLSEAERRPLLGGEGGHEISVRFLDAAPAFLRPGGKIYLLTSSESEAGVLRHAERDFSAMKVAEQRIFFEALAVWKLRIVD